MRRDLFKRNLILFTTTSLLTCIYFFTAICNSIEVYAAEDTGVEGFVNRLYEIREVRNLMISLATREET